MRIFLLFLSVTAFAKPTRTPEPPPIVIEAQMTSGPRKARAVEQAVQLSPSIQNCLRSSDLVRQEDFSVTVSGEWDENGTPSQVDADTSDMLFKSCLESAFTQVSAGPGPEGSFEVRILRSRASARGKKPKGLILDMKTPKKFE